MTGGDMGLPQTDTRQKLAKALTQPAQAMMMAAYPTDPSGMGGGKGYSDMTPAEFNQAAQDRANAGLVDRNIGPAAFGLGIPGIGVGGLLAGKMDQSMFEGVQGQRAQDFRGRGQSMPDEDMMAGYSGVGGQGGSPMGGVGVDVSGAQASAPGMFYAGGIVEGEDLMAAPVVHRELTSQWDNGDAGDPGESSEMMRWNNQDAAGFTNGGIVDSTRMTGPDPAGPDEGFVAVRQGEAILTPEQLAQLPPDARMKIARMLMGQG